MGDTRTDTGVGLLLCLSGSEGTLRPWSHYTEDQTAPPSMLRHPADRRPRSPFQGISARAERPSDGRGCERSRSGRPDWDVSTLAGLQASRDALGHVAGVDVGQRVRPGGFGPASVVSPRYPRGEATGAPAGRDESAKSVKSRWFVRTGRYEATPCGRKNQLRSAWPPGGGRPGG
jgi:hypothetical protein